MSSDKPKSRAKEKSKNLSVPQKSKHSEKEGSDVSSQLYTASAFARLNPVGGLEGMAKGVETWLWDRETLRLPRLKTSRPGELNQQVDEMVDLYNSVTNFCWPKAWKKPSDIPQRDPIHNDIRAQIFQDYEGYARASVEDMPEDVYNSVLNHLSILFKSVGSALGCRHQAERIGATECDARSAWDDILKAMCAPSTVVQSDSFFVERTISLPCNQAVAQGSNFPAVTQAATLHELLNNQLKKQLPIGGSTLNVVANSARHAYENYLRIATQGYSPKPGHRVHEPSSAIVDGICCLECPIKVPGQDLGPKNPADLNGFPSFINLFSNVKEAQTCTDGKTVTFKADIPGNEQNEAVSFDNSHARCFLCPKVTERLSSPPKSSLQSHPVADDLISIYIPFIVAEYKRDLATTHQSLHQVQMYSVACLEYLETIGITDFPVWGVVTSGTVGMIVMAWKSMKPYPEGNRPLNIMIDQAVRSFDLAEPLQALHFMTSIHRIYQQREKLEEKVSALGLADILTGKKAKTYRDWAMPPREKAPTISATQPDGSTKVV